jgi:hypothetical protein
LQVVADSKAHKANGGAGNKKISDMLLQHGFRYLQSKNIADFAKEDRIFICPDKADNALFMQVLEHYAINFEWSKNHENKQTDFCFKVGDKIFVMEHKHMKESGGGQDKQMSEIINFISYDDNAHYVAFLDGVYFNILADMRAASGKPYEQRKSIMEHLQKHKQNYFVNTAGFKELLSDILTTS